MRFMTPLFTIRGRAAELPYQHRIPKFQFDRMNPPSLCPTTVDHIPYYMRISRRQIVIILLLDYYYYYCEVDVYFCRYNLVKWVQGPSKCRGNQGTQYICIGRPGIRKEILHIAKAHPRSNVNVIDFVERKIARLQPLVPFSEDCTTYFRYNKKQKIRHVKDVVEPISPHDLTEQVAL